MSQVRQGTHPHPEVARPAGTGGGTRPGCSAGGHRMWAQDACPPSAVSQTTREATYIAIVTPGCGRRQAEVCEASNFSSPLSLGWGTPLSSQKQGPALTLWGLLQWLKKKLSLYPTLCPFCRACVGPGAISLGFKTSEAGRDWLRPEAGCFPQTRPPAWREPTFPTQYLWPGSL